MYQTIQVSSCVSVQGEFVELLANGQMVIRVGEKVYSGRPVQPRPLVRTVRSDGAAAAQSVIPTR